MKCILLAGGRGDRMWPLSRKNYPKQFIQIKNNHSIFQETIARNMPFCDEFIIVTNKDYQSIIENQVKAFRGLTYRCVYEEEGHGTAAAVILSSLQLPQSELIFVVASDQLISGKEYKDTILQAKSLAKKGFIVMLGLDVDKSRSQCEYVRYKDNDIVEFIGKFDKNCKDINESDYLINSGMFLFKNGLFASETKNNAPFFYSACETAYYMKKTVGNYTYYDENSMSDISKMSIEQAVIKNSKLGKVVKCDFICKEVGGLDDLDDEFLYDAINDKKKDSKGGKNQVISNKCDNTTVINRCNDKLVLVNQLENILVVNTDDAVYIGKKGKSNELKEIILESKNLWDYFNKSSLFFRKWGSYEVLSEDRKAAYQVRKVTLIPGKTIYAHKHSKKNENWSIISGEGRAIVNGENILLKTSSFISVDANIEHQISCISDEPLVFIETSTNVEYANEDIIDVESKDVSETELGFSVEPFVLLSPAYKDYLWGGDKLKKIYGKKGEFDVIAESWELSAHPDGQSMVASGKYEGMLFAEYIKRIGEENLGWKALEMPNFPLMIKLIDAKKDLSIQVHPGDEYALEHENEYGKSELWYVIDCDEDAFIYCGFNRDVTKEEVRDAIENKYIEKLLNKISVKPNKTYFIPSGTVHAIGKGCLICEIQQNSNSTYRLYDYDRVDKFGNKRKLDIDKALDVLDYKKYVNSNICKYFAVKVKNCKKTATLEVSDESFKAIVILDGEGEIYYKDSSLSFKKGDCVFIPKNNARMRLSGEFKYIESRI